MYVFVMVLSSYQRLFQSSVAIYDLCLNEYVRNFIAEFRTRDPDANQTLHSQAIDAALGD